MYTMEDLWFHVLENEPETLEVCQARRDFETQMEEFLEHADWMKVEPLWNQCNSEFVHFGFVIGFRAAVQLLGKCF